MANRPYLGMERNHLYANDPWTGLDRAIYIVEALLLDARMKEMKGKVRQTIDTSCGTLAWG